MRSPSYAENEKPRSTSKNATSINIKRIAAIEGKGPSVAAIRMVYRYLKLRDGNYANCQSILLYKLPLILRDNH